MTYSAPVTGDGMAQPCLTAPSVDKWDLLSALTQAAENFGLSHRTLGVLKALMTFHPGREISPEPHQAIVFPANRTLSDRLNGMPESTLRRHLAQLVKLGVVDRRASANNKRFARKVGQRIAVAFGFDLSPLARAAQQIMDAAIERETQMQKNAVLRQSLIAMRQSVIDETGPNETTEMARLLLRRKASLADLQNALNALNAMAVQLTPKPAAVETDEMSSNGSQNERHLQVELDSISDSEVVKSKVTLYDVKQACKEFRCYFTEPVNTWEDLHQIVCRIAPMIGIDQPVLISAQRELGRDAANIAVLCILERLSEIASPGAYLRRLTQNGRASGLDVRPMLSAISTRHVKIVS